MTRKDYVAIARVIASCQTMPNRSNPQYVLYEVTQRLVTVLAADNPRFDRSRFLKACGVQS